MLKIFNTFGRKIPTNSGSLLEISKNVKIPNVNSQRESSGGFHSKYVSKLVSDIIIIIIVILF